MINSLNNSSISNDLYPDFLSGQVLNASLNIDNIVAEPASLKITIGNYDKDSKTREGLKQLDKLGYDIVGIRGDGHCLFGAITAWILRYLKEASPNERHYLLSTLNQIVEGCSRFKPLSEVANEFFSDLENALS